MLIQPSVRTVKNIKSSEIVMDVWALNIVIVAEKYETLNMHHVVFLVVEQLQKSNGA